MRVCVNKRWLDPVFHCFPVRQDIRTVAPGANPGQNTLSPPPPNNNDNNNNNNNSTGSSNSSGGSDEPAKVLHTAAVAVYESPQAPKGPSPVAPDALTDPSSKMQSPLTLSSPLPLEREYNELQGGDMPPYSLPMSSKGEYIQILEDESSFDGSRYFQAIEKSNVLMVRVGKGSKTPCRFCFSFELRTFLSTHTRG